MASTSQIVDAFVTRLRGILPQLSVEHYAGAPAEYRLEHPQGALLLSYRGDQFAAPRDTAGFGQQRTLQLELTLLLRCANAQFNDTEALDVARRACLGLPHRIVEPRGCRPKPFWGSATALPAMPFRWPPTPGRWRRRPLGMSPC